MPRFYFHLHNAIGFLGDEEGQEAPDLEAARQTAIDSIRDILSNEVRSGRFDLRGRSEITNDAQQLVAAVAYAEAVELHLQPERS